MADESSGEASPPSPTTSSDRSPTPPTPPSPSAPLADGGWRSDISLVHTRKAFVNDLYQALWPELQHQATTAAAASFREQSLLGEAGSKEEYIRSIAAELREINDRVQKQEAEDAAAAAAARGHPLPSPRSDLSSGGRHNRLLYWFVLHDNVRPPVIVAPAPPEDAYIIVWPQYESSPPQLYYRLAADIDLVAPGVATFPADELLSWLRNCDRRFWDLQPDPVDALSPDIRASGNSLRSSGARSPVMPASPVKANGTSIASAALGSPVLLSPGTPSWALPSPQASPALKSPRSSAEALATRQQSLREIRGTLLFGDRDVRGVVGPTLGACNRLVSAVYKLGMAVWNQDAGAVMCTTPKVVKSLQLLVTGVRKLLLAPAAVRALTSFRAALVSEIMQPLIDVVLDLEHSRVTMQKWVETDAVTLGYLKKGDTVCLDWQAELDALFALVTRDLPAPDLMRELDEARFFANKRETERENSDTQ